jgi:BCD family chlorophyll transporter-like MFS transporter
VAIKEVWGEDHARRFTIFVFASMLAYSAQDLILEPFVGLTFGWTVGETTALAGMQHAGMLLGMFAMAFSTYAFKSRTRHILHLWIRGGCLVSAASLALLALGGLIGGASWPINLNVFILGVANGSFAVAAIGGMMMLASQGRSQRDGLRMGLWGAAQAISFALGGFLGTVAVDVASLWLDNPAAYGLVFFAEAALFVWAASLIFDIDQQVQNTDRENAVTTERFPLENPLGGINP